MVEAGVLQRAYSFLICTRTLSNSALAAARRSTRSAAWGIVGVKIADWVRHWDEKHQPIIILVNFLLADCPRLRCIKLCLLSGESFADENLVRTVPQRASLIFEYCKISPERFTCSAPVRFICGFKRRLSERTSRR